MVQRLPDPPLVPSSMQGGNTVSDSAALSMTAPGSAPALPTPQTLDRLPMPEMTNGTPIPVSNQRDRVTGNPAPGGDGGWSQSGASGHGWSKT